MSDDGTVVTVADMIQQLSENIEEFDEIADYYKTVHADRVTLGTAQQSLEKLSLIQAVVTGLRHRILREKPPAAVRDSVKGTYTCFNRNWMTLTGSVRDIVNVKTPAVVSQATVAHTENHEQQQMSTVAKPKIKFPTIQLPEFDGSLEKWLQFRDTFSSLVHSNSVLTRMEKYHYLTSSIKLPSSHMNVLNNFPLTEASYEDAWAAIKERYDDKRKLKSQHLTTLFTIKKMSSESSCEMRRVLDSFSSAISTLKLLETTYDDILVHVALFRLDEATLKDWQKHAGDDDQTWHRLKEFLTHQWRALDQVPQKKTQKPPETRSSSSRSFTTKGDTKSDSPSQNSSRSHAASSSSSCVVCHETHFLFQCSKFRAMSVSERYNVVNSNRLCRNCLNPGHMSSKCANSGRCKTCQQPHHTMLHRDSAQSQTSRQVSSSGSQQSPPVETAQNESSVAPFAPYPPPSVRQSHMSCVSSFSNKFTKRALISTAVVYVQDARKEWHKVRVLLDSASQGNFITYQLAHRLGVPIVDAPDTLEGVSCNTSTIKHDATVRLVSGYGHYEPEVTCAVLDEITSNLPNRYIATNHMQIPKGVFLADPTFNQPGRIDMLLGAGIWFDSMLMRKMEFPNTPVMQETKFGWILGGSLGVENDTSSFISCFTYFAQNAEEELDKKLEKFMEVENFGTSSKVMSRQEDYCEETYKKTTKQDENGRYIVQLPFNVSINKLGNNRQNAYHRFIYQEKMRLKDPELNRLYIEYMRNYISVGHMSVADPSKQDQGHFLPHHGVKKSSSNTTKVRPVFNASCKSETGISLNDCLCVGPTVQPESFDILLRFRECSYVLKSDIEKMYRQVFLEKTQRKFQKIFWRESPDEQLKQYKLNTVTFGLSSAAYLATRTLIQIALDHEEEFPEACSIIKSCFYVDDLLFGFNNITEGLCRRDEIRYLLARSCMPIRQWTSNQPALLNGLPEKDVENASEAIKTLGMFWMPEQDTLTIHIKSPPANVVITKTLVLSEIASIYDPIGFVGPVVLRAKLFMKILWRLKLSWTQELPDDIKNNWLQFRSTLESLNQLKIDRHSIITNPTSIEIHGFCDASEDAYGAIIYLRSTNALHDVKISICCSKSRVSPAKQKSIARLELCAATLLSKLVSRVTSILTVNIATVHLWSDSMIVLHWILSPPEKLSTFVGNRVSVIQDHTSHCVWKHIRGELNPADVISRGLPPHELADKKIWWNGPDFLQLPQQQWPESLLTINDDDPAYNKEIRKTLITQQHSSLFTVIESRFSKFQKLVNFFCYLRRLTARSSMHFRGPLTMDEKEAANFNIIRIVQKSKFPSEYNFLFEQLNQNIDQLTVNNISKNSPLRMLSPYMDPTHHVMRVRGRLQNCEWISDDQMHPIILPECHYSKLVLRELHEKHSHPPANTLLSIVRQRYWPLRAKSMIRHINRHCMRCFRVRPIPAEQYMGSLPRDRVTMTPPFTTTAVDYAGYFNIRNSLTNRSTIVKAYIAMFKCMCTGAIHVEAVTSLSTPAFIAAFERFISRRGLPTDMYSDNGTNFVGADNEFKSIISTAESSIKHFLEEKFIKWHFTTPLAPHAGGYYEAGIKTIKHHLIREMSNYSFDFEQFSTLLTKIEAIVNSRPLMPMSEDPQDSMVLTPAHFLIGRSLITKPERNFIPVRENRLDRWNRLQKITQQIWNFWYHDYLHHLQSRPKHFRDVKEFKIGDMVVIKDNNLPPLKWLVGRIIRLIPAKKDKVVRNVVVKTAKREYERHVKTLCPLPFIRDDSITSPVAGECDAENDI